MRGGLTQLGRPLKGKSLTESQEGLPGLDPRGGKDRKGKRRRQAGGGKAGSGLSGRRSKSYPLRKGFPCIFYLLCPLFCGLEKRERATCPAWSENYNRLWGRHIQAESTYHQDGGSKPGLPHPSISRQASTPGV